ncbi:MAG: hypothetical protein M3P91_06005 [Actinomycetota bacterium]|nr:hypothetical protein [Actinomycetota bacterium]
MGWTWRYESSTGQLVDPGDAGTLEPAPSQSDAETWLGENWRQLRGAGVDAVVLLEDDRVVYGPMSLHPPEAPHSPEA